jgi:pSer/pThr/pTyr-binding forkhead associated (FHA) protein
MTSSDVHDVQSPPAEATDSAIMENTYEFDRQKLLVQTDKLSLGSLLAKSSKPVYLEVDGKRIELPSQATVILGRRVSDTNSEQPDVALNAFGATEKGVSRRHARISRYSNLICISDMGSSNGTFVNGQQVIKNDTRILHNGDEVQLSFLKMQIQF